jgi:hypothetical protein
MIKSPVYDELAQAAVCSLSSISRILWRTAPAQRVFAGSDCANLVFGNLRVGTLGEKSRSLAGYGALWGLAALSDHLASSPHRLQRTSTLLLLLAACFDNRVGAKAAA